MTSSASSPGCGLVRSAVGVEYCIMSDVVSGRKNEEVVGTFLVPVTHAGLVILARRGIVRGVCMRGAQLSGAAVRLKDVQSDMCGM
jgi:hypothetical protein